MEKVLRDLNDLNSKKFAIERATEKLRTETRELNNRFEERRSELTQKRKMLQETEKINLETLDNIENESALTNGIQNHLKDISNMRRSFREHQEQLCMEHRAAILADVVSRADQCRKAQSALHRWDCGSFECPQPDEAEHWQRISNLLYKNCNGRNIEDHLIVVFEKLKHINAQAKAFQKRVENSESGLQDKYYDFIHHQIHDLECRMCRVPLTNDRCILCLQC